MDTKPLLFGLIGFFMGGLLVSIAATTFEKPTEKSSDMSMSHMTASLKDKQGDEFDQAFIDGMIDHHQGAVEMARIAEQNAKHEELKTLSRNIITSQEEEISVMRQWRHNWGYSAQMMEHDSAGH